MQGLDLLLFAIFWWVSGVISGLVASYMSMVVTTPPEPKEPELCSHGYEWDSCPDCCH